MLRPKGSYPLSALARLVAAALSGCPPPSAATSSAAPLAAHASVPSGGSRFVQKLAGGSLLIEVCADDVIRVVYAKDAAFFARSTLMTAPKRCKSSPVRTLEEESAKTLVTAKVKIRIDLQTGAVSFRDLDDHVILAERAGALPLSPECTLTLLSALAEFERSSARRSMPCGPGDLSYRRRRVRRARAGARRSGACKRERARSRWTGAAREALQRHGWPARQRLELEQLSVRASPVNRQN